MTELQEQASDLTVFKKKMFKGQGFIQRKVQSKCRNNHELKKKNNILQKKRERTEVVSVSAYIFLFCLFVLFFAWCAFFFPWGVEVIFKDIVEFHSSSRNTAP